MAEKCGHFFSNPRRERRARWFRRHRLAALVFHAMVFVVAYLLVGHLLFGEDPDVGAALTIGIPVAVWITFWAPRLDHRARTEGTPPTEQS